MKVVKVKAQQASNVEENKEDASRFKKCIKVLEE